MKSSPAIWLASVISFGKFSMANASHVFLLLSPSFLLLSSLCICTFSICLSEFWNIPFYFLSAISVLETSMCPSLCLLILYLALPTLLASPWMMLLFFVRVFWSLEHLFGFLLVFSYLCWHFLVYFSTLALTMLLIIIVSSQCNDFRFSAMSLSSFLACSSLPMSMYFLPFGMLVTLCRNQVQCTGWQELR